MALGLAGALTAGKLLTRFLYGVTPADPTTFAGVVGLFAFVSAVACYARARRASRVDLLEMLRHE